MRLALLPIGAFRPDGSCGRGSRLPKDAVRAAQALESRRPVPDALRTFHLGDDGQDEPLNVLRQELVHAPA